MAAGSFFFVSACDAVGGVSSSESSVHALWQLRMQAAQTSLPKVCSQVPTERVSRPMSSR